VFFDIAGEEAGGCRLQVKATRLRQGSGAPRLRRGKKSNGEDVRTFVAASTSLGRGRRSAPSLPGDAEMCGYLRLFADKCG